MGAIPRIDLNLTMGLLSVPHGLEARKMLMVDFGLAFN